MEFIEKVLAYADKDPAILIYAGIFLVLAVIVSCCLFLVLKKTKITLFKQSIKYYLKTSLTIAVLAIILLLKLNHLASPYYHPLT